MHLSHPESIGQRRFDPKLRTVHDFAETSIHETLHGSWSAGSKSSLPEVHDRTMALRRSLFQVAHTLRQASVHEYEVVGSRCAALFDVRTLV